jgi:hypothetical protein
LLNYTHSRRQKELANQSNTNKSKGNPEKIAREMLSKTYDQLEVKDMSKEAFINECTNVLKEKVNNKSSIILPGQ